MKLNLEARAVDNVTVLYCKGRFTYHDEASAFSNKVAELLPHAPRLILELSELEGVDSAALGELVVVHMWARASGCAIKVAAASHQILQLFELTNLIDVLEVHPTLDDALLSFREQIATQKKAFHAA